MQLVKNVLVYEYSNKTALLAILSILGGKEGQSEGLKLPAQG